jgi:hypothetical protein
MGSLLQGCHTQVGISINTEFSSWISRGLRVTMDATVRFAPAPAAPLA